jgi:hypothetical protein
MTAAEVSKEYNGKITRIKDTDKGFRAELNEPVSIADCDFKVSFLFTNPGERLAGVSLMRNADQRPTFDSIVNLLTSKYGPAASNVKKMIGGSLTSRALWIKDKTKITLDCLEAGSIGFLVISYDPKEAGTDNL